MLSVIIPSYKDPLLRNTIDSLLVNATGDIEIIAVLDGYWPGFELPQDKRINIVHLGKNGGMRNAINHGVRIARGEYIMRTDEHCVFAQGFDTTILETIQDNWIVTMLRFFLDPVAWKILPDPCVGYEKLVIQGGKKFAGQRWTSRDEERKAFMVDETMAMQGSVWVMKKSWWDKVIGELQTEGYGQLIQDSHEMVFKTWQAGGKLMLNKNTWFAHKHRRFSRTHNNGTEETPANCEQGYAYALKVWGDYYNKIIKPKWKI